MSYSIKIVGILMSDFCELGQGAVFGNVLTTTVVEGYRFQDGRMAFRHPDWSISIASQTGMHRPECTFLLDGRDKQNSRSDLGYDLILSARTSSGRGGRGSWGTRGSKGY